MVRDWRCRSSLMFEGRRAAILGRGGVIPDSDSRKGVRIWPTNAFCGLGHYEGHPPHFSTSWHKHDQVAVVHDRPRPVETRAGYCPGDRGGEGHEAGRSRPVWDNAPFLNTRGTRPKKGHPLPSPISVDGEDQSTRDQRPNPPTFYVGAVWLCQ